MFKCPMLFVPLIFCKISSTTTFFRIKELRLSSNSEEVSIESWNFLFLNLKWRKNAGIHMCWSTITHLALPRCREELWIFGMPYTLQKASLSFHLKEDIKYWVRPFFAQDTEELLSVSIENTELDGPSGLICSAEPLYISLSLLKSTPRGV